MICFLTSQFFLQGYLNPFKKDRTSKGDGILLYVRKDIPCKIIKTENNTYYEGFSIEVNFTKKVVNKFYL